MNSSIDKFLCFLTFFITLFFVANNFGQEDASKTKNFKPKLIKGDVFIIEKTTSRLPSDFSKLPQITTIFVNEINVPTRVWNNGFPDLPEIYEWFAIEYKVTMRINQDGNYKFRLVSDDGAKLYIDKKLIVDNDGTHQFLPVSNSAKLAKGEYSFKLQFFQGPRYEAGIQLFVKKDGEKEVIFPGDEIELVAENAANSNSKQ